MGSSGQLYSLSWGEFGSSLTTAVQLLRGHGDLVDVTLAAGGRSFPAHKIVLSAASPFLLDLLKSTPCQHPVVMLAGISSDDLESLLEFVYRGEVSVEPSQLPSLLQAAHCLNIHGLTPPTVLTENGEAVPPSAIPEASEPITRETMNSSIPNQRRRKRRKSSSSCSKWPRLDNTTDSEERQEDDRTTDYDQKTEEPTPGDEGTGDDSSHRLPENQSPPPVKLEDTPQELVDTKQHLQNLLQGMQFSSLSFPSGLVPPGLIPSTSAAGMNASKARGASDCPGQCALCGATLRQARNLRRHLLTSCKYRFNSHPAVQHMQDQMVVEIKPDIDMSGYIGPTYMTDSGGSNSCEPILFRTSPMPSPGGRGAEVVGSHQNGPSPTIAR
ncbi:transcription factor GAGA isoform X3 [Diachasma alloeum]|uniref:transcription factor GAGA isoform X3 n=1 Tax=Diachasma alloeum TaxID=454923 RepID=UPI0007382585|nr:transcription factor GAGA isoform X3 [Diachasma alloeum]